MGLGNVQALDFRVSVVVVQDLLTKSLRSIASNQENYGCKSQKLSPKLYLNPKSMYSTGLLGHIWGCWGIILPTFGAWVNAEP